MMRRLLTSLRRDNRINWRNYYYLVTIAVALVYLALVLWLIPGDTTLKPVVYLVDATSEQRYAPYAQQRSAEEPLAGDVVVVGSIDAIEAAMAENQNSVGVVVRDSGGPLPEVLLYFQRFHNQQVRNMMAVSLEDTLREVYALPWSSRVAVSQELLRGQAGAPVPFNLQLVPFLLFSDTALIGVIFIAALIFMEKDEGTLRAYLVTPGRVWEYLLSKALTLALLAVIFTLIMAPVTLGLRPNYLQLLAVMVAGSLFASLLGALIAVYFDNLTQFLFPAILLMLVLSLPGIAYFVPSFAPAWLRLMPTYGLVFGLREAAFPSGNPQIVVNAVVILAALSAVLLVLSSMAFKRQIARA